MTFQYYILNKPYGVLCQFSPVKGKQTLAQFGPLPKDIYPVGRLDEDSEGLLLLTNDGKLKHLLIEPQYKHPRTYLVQIERVPALETLEQLRQGIMIVGKNTLPADVELLETEPNVQPRAVPIRVRKTIPTAWLKLTLYEGRNRQVRKMTAAVGHPALRLIRIQLANLTLKGLHPGEVRLLSVQEVEDLKRIIIPRRLKIEKL